MATNELCYDPSTRAVIDNPFPLFARLQREAPVHWSAPLRGWVVTRHEDCFCIGAPLARLEGRIALPILAERIRHPRLIGAAPEWLDSLSFRGLTALPLAGEFVARGA
ncbi:MAG: hypothetical protein WAV22_01485 [Porticoccaceae bacterium]